MTRPDNNISVRLTSGKGCAAPCPRRASLLGYTLIELLAVMAIVVIIILIAVASYSGMTRAAAPRKAAENIEVALSLARQYAISKNTPVLFLILDDEFDGRNTAADANISKIGPTRGRHYATFDPLNRVYVMGWTELPQGVVFDRDYAGVGQAGRNVIDTPADMFWDRKTGKSMIPFPTGWGGTSDTNRLVSLPGVAFKTDGTVYVRPSDTPGSRRINVAEGSVDAAGVVTVRSGGIKYGVRVSMMGHAAVEDNP